MDVQNGKNNGTEDYTIRAITLVINPLPTQLCPLSYQLQPFLYP